MRTPGSLSWVVLAAAASQPVLANPPDTPEPKLSVQSPLAQLGFKFGPAAETPPVPAIFTHAPPVIEMEADLPVFLVEAPRSKLSSNDVATPKLRVEQAVNKYTTPLYRTTFGPLSQVAAYVVNPLSILGGWHPNEAESMLLREQDRRIEMLQELQHLSHLDAIGDPDSGKIDREVGRDEYTRTR